MKHLFTYNEHVNEQVRRLFTKILPKIEPWMVKNLKPVYNAIKQNVEDLSTGIDKFLSRKLSEKDWEGIWEKLRVHYRKINKGKGWSDKFDIPHSSSGEKVFYFSSEPFFFHEETGFLVNHGKLSGWRDSPIEAKEIIKRQYVDTFKKYCDELGIDDLKIYFETQGDDYSIIIGNL